MTADSETNDPRPPESHDEALRLSKDAAYIERAARTLREEQAGVPNDVMDPEQWAEHCSAEGTGNDRR